MIRTAVVALGLLFSQVAHAATVDADVTIGNAVEGFVRPGYAALHKATQELGASLDNLCANPATSSLSQARDAFSRTVDAWSEIEIIRFGPITKENRLERILFWPDRKSIGLKQVQAALAAKDTSVTDAGKLKGKSVAVQGLGALEFLLYGTGAEGLAGNDEAFRCDYGRAIAKNLDTIAGAVEAEWGSADGYGAQWRKAGPNNSLYRDDNEALTELLEVFVNGLELVRDQRLGGFLSEKSKNDKPRQALFWRSEKTANSLAGNMRGMRNLFITSKITEKLSENASWIGLSIDFEFRNAVNAADASKGSIADVLSDPKRRAKLMYFGVVTSSLSELFGTRLSADLGLTAGFSSLDGD